MTRAHNTPGSVTRERTVLHLAESFSSGVASAIEAYLEAQPSEVRAIVSGFRVPDAQLAPRVQLGVPFFELPSGKWPQMRAVRAVIAEHRPDIVHLHSSWAGLFARAMPLPAGTRVVYTPHCYGFERLDTPRALRAGLLAAEMVLGMRTDVVLACGTHEADLARTRHLGRTVLLLPQQLPEHLRASLAKLRATRTAGGDRLIVGMSGRICAQKGPDFFAAVARGLRATPEGRDAFVLRWIGGGRAGADAELRTAGVEVTGWLTQRESVGELAACDIYLHSAAWEGAPMTVLEARELGLPVIARAIPSLIADSEGIRLVADPAEAVSTLLKFAVEWPVAVEPPRITSLAERRAILACAYGLA